MNSARERIRVAHALAGLPKIDEAFSKGALSYSKARAITRVADASTEEYLLMVATHGTAHHVERLVTRYRRAKKLQDAETYMNNSENSGSTADRYQVVVHGYPKGTSTAETPSAKWNAGEQMDWDYAVSLMFTANPHGPM